MRTAPHRSTQCRADLASPSCSFSFSSSSSIPQPFRGRGRQGGLIALLVFVALLCRASAEPGAGPALSVPRDRPLDAAHQLPPRNWIDQTELEADRKSVGCIECHKGIEPMHTSKNVVLGCTDCHGGNAAPGLTQSKAHVEPRNPVFWQSSANPNDS